MRPFRLSVLCTAVFFAGCSGGALSELSSQEGRDADAMRAAAAPRMVGYYTNWSQYRPGNCKFLPANLNPQQYTHINFAFAKLTATGSSRSNPGEISVAPYEWNDI